MDHRQLAADDPTRVKPSTLHWYRRNLKIHVLPVLGDGTLRTSPIGNIAFDNVYYDSDADVLYLHVGDPRTAVDFDESPEGHALRFDAAGDLVGITIVSPRHFLDRDGKVEITLPPRHVDVDATQLDDAIAAA